MSDKIGESVVGFVYPAAGLATFVYLTFFDGYIYTAWNWIIAIPINLFLSGIWPLYWLVLHWIT